MTGRPRQEGSDRTTRDASRRPPLGLRDDLGAGSVLVVAVVAALLAATAVALPVGGLLAARQRVSAAADAAALAGADAVAGIRPGPPCAAAEQLAALNAARLDACTAEGPVVTVTVSARVGGLSLGAAATAGPPT